MDRALVFLSLLALYIVGGTVLALLYRRHGDEREYYIASGRMGGVLSALTYAATTYSSFMIVGLVGIAYFTGFGSLGFELAYYVATLGLLATFGYVVWKLSKKKGWITPTEMLGEIYGSRLLAAFIALFYIIALLPYASAQLKGIGEPVAQVLGTGDEGYRIGVGLAVILVLVWTLISGIWSVAVTDALQGLVMVSSALLLLIWVSYEARATPWSMVSKLYHEEPSLVDVGGGGFWNFTTFLAFTTPWIFFATTNPQVLQRLYLPRDRKGFRGMLLWFAIFGLLYTIIVVLIGTYAKAYADTLFGSSPPSSGKDTVTPALIGVAPIWLGALVFISIVAASISTVDSIVLSVSSSVAHDASPRAWKRKELLVTRIIVVLIALAAGLIAAKRISYIVQLSVVSSLLLLPLAPPTISGIYLLYKCKKASPRMAWTSILAGLAVIAYATYMYGVGKVLTAQLLGVPAGLVVLVVSSIPSLIQLWTAENGKCDTASI